MTKQVEVKHNIQKHIIGILLHQKIARFRDMRPPRADSNLYSYHLTQIIQSGFVKKVDGGYTLDTTGLIYVDRLDAESLFVRQQPKIITMFVIQNSNGDILLQRRRKQPFIDTWTLPGGKIHNDDKTVLVAAEREVLEKLGVTGQTMSHAGDCYVRIYQNKSLMTVTLAHIFAFNCDDIKTNDDTQWMRPHKLARYDVAPAVEQIVTRTFFRDPFYFEEFEENW